MKNTKYDYLKPGYWVSSQHGTHIPIKTRQGKSRQSFNWVVVLFSAAIIALVVLYFI